MKRRVLLLVAMVMLLLVAVGTAAAAAEYHARVMLRPVAGSGVHGKVNLWQLPSEGTLIVVTAKGLKPGNKYVSLYYDNHACRLEPYSKDDIIGGPYTAGPTGVGHTSGVADDDLDEINSVSVRSARTFKLLACADVHP